MHIFAIYKVMKKSFLLSTIFILCLFAGCNVTGGDALRSESDKKVTLCCWNAQTFFDAEKDGTEYSDFQNYSKWSKDKYLQRLDRLCQVMTTLNPDVMVLEEIENAAVVQDVANRLAGNSWSKKNCWSYAAFARTEGAAIGCAVFSRYPLEGMKVHSLDVRTQMEEQPQARPLLQVGVEVEGCELMLLVNHWKSKSGGAEETEIWRDWQELVCERVVGDCKASKGDCAIVVCGDFNRDAADFVRNGVFRGAAGTVELYSPWFTKAGVPVNGNGSYYYQENWERIDNIFVGGNVNVSGFGARTNGDWADSSGIPNSFKIYSGEGYSDHLPLMCFLVL